MKETSPQDKKYGIMKPLLEAMGGEAKVLESQHVIQQMKEMIDKDIASIMVKILAQPTDVPNWQDQIALLLGEAKAYIKQQERFTIKER